MVLPLGLAAQEMIVSFRSSAFFLPFDEKFAIYGLILRHFKFKTNIKNDV